MIKKDTSNTFEGLMMDLNPIQTPNSVLTNALNATIITYNGNELVLQNDIGNGRVETAYLPEGYVPLGTTQLGGIIYIVSYNPLTDKCQIGSFPSPERNITSDELGNGSKKEINTSQFYSVGNYVTKNTIRAILHDKELHSGDKFAVFSEDISKITDKLSAYNSKEPDVNDLPRQLKLYLASIQDNGRIVILKDLTWYTDNDNPKEQGYGYYIKNSTIRLDKGKLDLNEYRDLVKSNYSVFNSKVAGKLAVVVKLETIDTYSISLDFKITGNETDKIAYIYSYSNWTYENEFEESRGKVNPIGIHCLVEDPKKKIDNEVNTDYKAFKGSGETEKAPNLIDLYTQINVEEGKDSQEDQDSEGTIEFEDGSTLPYFKVDINGNSIYRKNDGSDEDYLKYLCERSYAIDYEPTTDGTRGEIISDKVKFTLMPAMEFGYLDYLKTDIEVDFAKLGTGITELNEYRYYVEDQYLTLSYGFESYPEIGKKVKGVTFKFFELSRTNVNQIVNWSDSKKFLKIKTGESSSEDFGPDTKEGRVLLTAYEKSPSILGHFSQRIYFKGATPQLDEENSTESWEGIEKDKCYIVKITINYNDEEKRIYYRLLYTNSVFNSAYYEDGKEDYNDLYLEDYLKANYTVTNPELTSSVERKYYKIVDSGSDLELLDKRFPNTNDDNEIVNYKIVDVFKNNYTATIEATPSPNSSMFKWTIESANIQKIKEEDKDDYTFSNDATQKYVTVPDSTLKIEQAFDGDPSITTTNKGNKLKLEATQKVTSPIQVNYGTQYEIPIKYEAKPLEGDIFYLCSHGRDEGLRVGFVSSYIDVTGSEPGFETGDDQHKEWSSLATMGAAGEAAKSELVNRDWIAVVCTVYYNKDARCNLEFWNGNTITAKYGEKGGVNANYGAAAVMLCMKTSNSIDAIFNTSNKYTSTAIGSGWKFSTRASIETSKNNIENMFNFIYKLVNNSGGGNLVYIYDNIIWWSNYNASISVTKNLNINIRKLSINGIEIDPITVEKTPRGGYPNLYYLKADNQDISVSISNYVNLEQVPIQITSTNYIQNIVKYGTETLTVLDDNGYTTSDFVSPSNRVLYTIQEDDKTIKPRKFLDAAGSSGDIRIESDGTNVFISKISTTKRYKFMWVQEEQKQSINNIVAKGWTPSAT